MDYDFVVRWNQSEGTNSGLVLSITGYFITYANFPILLEIQLQTKIVLSTMGDEYIMLSCSMRDVLYFVSLVKEIGFTLELQRYTLKFLCGNFEKLVTVNKDNQG